MWTCDHCGEEVEADWEVCWNCTTRRSSLASPAAPQQSPPPQPRPSKICARCGSTKLVPDLVLAPRSMFDAVMVRIPTRSWIDIFLRAKEVPMRVVACGECGFCDLYVSDPVALWAAYSSPRKPTVQGMRVLREKPLAFNRKKRQRRN